MYNDDLNCFQLGVKTIIFEIEYWTQPNEIIVLLGTGGPLQWNIKDAILLARKDGGKWRCEIEVANEVSCKKKK